MKAELTVLLRRQPPYAPAGERSDDRLEAKPGSGQRIYLGSGRGRQHLTFDESLVLEASKARREHVCRNSRQAVEQVAIALRPGEQLPDDEQRPPLADGVQGARNRAELAIAATGHGHRVPERDSSHWSFHLLFPSLGEQTSEYGHE